MKKFIALVLGFFALSFYSWSQTLTTADDGNKETKIVFTMANGKSANIYKIESVSFGTSSTFHTSANGYLGSSTGMSSGSNVTFVCATPAEMTLDKGAVQLQVGLGSTAKSFTVTATGGTQEWSVKAGNEGGYWGGILVGSFGLSFAVSGIALGAAGLGSGFMVMGVVGAIASVTGFIVMANSGAKVTLVKVSL